jgi:hypothetical protein
MGMDFAWRPRIWAAMEKNDFLFCLEESQMKIDSILLDRKGPGALATLVWGRRNAMKPTSLLAFACGILFLPATLVQADADIPKLIKALDDPRNAVALGAIEKLGNQGSAAK